jgi:hypothetical protein
MTALVVVVSAAGLGADGVLEATTRSALARFAGTAALTGGAWIAIVSWYFLRDRARRRVDAAPQAIAP